MSFELLKRVDVGLLHPGLVNRVVEMLSACREAGFEYWAISGFRGVGEQMALYEQGRTRPGPVVTNARPFQSAHNFGLAIDFARDHGTTRAGLRGGWGPDGYEELGRQARAHGLVWGGDFTLRDWSHVQLPGVATAAELESLQRVYASASVPGQAGDGRTRERARLIAAWMHLNAGNSAYIWSRNTLADGRCWSGQT